jgi:hypothetical protein
MSASQRQSLWEALSERGLVQGDQPVVSEARAPWFVRVMLGIAGWIGALFLLGFVGAGFVFVMKNSGVQFLVGAGACAAAVAIFRAAPKNDFVAQFGLAVSFAGQALMVAAAVQWFDRSTIGIALFIALQQAVLFILVPNFVHRLWTAWSGALAAAYALLDAGLFAFTPAATTLAFAWVALSQFRLASHGSIVRAGMYGLALAAAQTAVMHGGLAYSVLFGGGSRVFVLGEPGVWLGRAASFAVLAWAVAALLRREGLGLSSGPGRVGFAGALILGLVSIKAPGVAPMVVILVLGYANADRILVGLGILGLLGYLSHYYYALHATLLEKSMLLVATGIALLGVRLAMRQWWPDDDSMRRQSTNAEAGHA